MAEIQNTEMIGDLYSAVAASSDRDSAYGKLQAHDTAMESAGHAAMHAMPAGLFPLPLFIFTSVGASSSGDSVRYKAPRPLKIWCIDTGCESAGGATGTVDVYVDNGTTDAHILDAAVDVKTAAGTMTRTAPEEDKELVAYGSEIYIKGASGGGGSLVGAQAILWCQFQ